MTMTGGLAHLLVPPLGWAVSFCFSQRLYSIQLLITYNIGGQSEEEVEPHLDIKQAFPDLVISQYSPAHRVPMAHLLIPPGGVFCAPFVHRDLSAPSSSCPSAAEWITHLTPLDLALLHIVVIVPLARHDDDFLLPSKSLGLVWRVGDDERHCDAPRSAQSADNEELIAPHLLDRDLTNAKADQAPKSDANCWIRNQCHGDFGGKTYLPVTRTSIQ